MHLSHLESLDQGSHVQEPQQQVGGRTQLTTKRRREEKTAGNEGVTDPPPGQDVRTPEEEKNYHPEDSYDEVQVGSDEDLGAAAAAANRTQEEVPTKGHKPFASQNIQSQDKSDEATTSTSGARTTTTPMPGVQLNDSSVPQGYESLLSKKAYRLLGDRPPQPNMYDLPEEKDEEEEEEKKIPDKANRNLQKKAPPLAPHKVHHTK